MYQVLENLYKNIPYQQIANEDTVIFTKDSFEHMLNCIDIAVQAESLNNIKPLILEMFNIIQCWSDGIDENNVGDFNLNPSQTVKDLKLKLELMGIDITSK